MDLVKKNKKKNKNKIEPINNLNNSKKRSKEIHIYFCCSHKTHSLTLFLLKPHTKLSLSLFLCYLIASSGGTHNNNNVCMCVWYYKRV